MKFKLVIPQAEKIGDPISSFMPEQNVVTKGDRFTRFTPQEKLFQGNGYREAIHEVLKDKGENSQNPFIVAGDNPEAEEALASGQTGIIKNTRLQIIPTLEDAYVKQVKPQGIIFDYSNPEFNIHSYIHELFLKSNLHLFREIPLIVGNYNSDRESLIDQIKVLAVNGSPSKKGATKKMLTEEVDKFWTGPYYKSSFANLKNITECLGCGGHQAKCVPECMVDDQMKELMPQVLEADVLLLASPVYMDGVTSRMMAFLSRLTGQTKFNRRAYIGKYASALSPAYCSGTKAVISTLMNTAEMMGFSIQGRSHREFIQLWNDGKTRGGVPAKF
jgi:multimeric flavodoxin WrbA